MFLNVLNLEQKTAFLELAHMLANADGVVVNEEETLLLAYESEMQMERGAYKVKGISLQSVLEKFSDERSRKIAYVEILALAQVDSLICDREQSIIDKVEKVFAITTEQKERFLNWLERLNQLYAEGSELVYG